MHSKHWFSLARILERLTDDKPINSGTLRPLCPGSMNNGGFILAALRHEGLVKPLEGAEHGMVRVDPTGYLAEVEQLLAAKVAIALPVAVDKRILPRPNFVAAPAPSVLPLSLGRWKPYG